MRHLFVKMRVATYTDCMEIRSRLRLIVVTSCVSFILLTILQLGLYLWSLRIKDSENAFYRLEVIWYVQLSDANAFFS